MVVGFNHNFTYKGVVYHIQTEDGGLGSPNIITLLYHGGTILASRKTSYADITKVDQLQKVVEDLMKEQHKGMLRSLKIGEFDGIIERYNLRREKAPSQQEVAVAAPAKPVPAPQPQRVAPMPSAPVVKPVPGPGPPAAKPAHDAVAAPATRKAVEKKERPTVEASLDEIILSYLMGDER